MITTSPFSIVLERVSNAFLPPDHGFTIYARLTNLTKHSWVVYNAWSEVDLGSRGNRLARSTPCKLPSIVDAGAKNVFVDIRVPVTNATLTWIENRRNGNGGLRLSVTIEGTVAPFVRPKTQGEGMQWGEPGVIRIECEPMGEGLEVSRDTWLPMLQAMGFGSYELFELPTSGLVTHPDLRTAVADLNGARTAFQLGDWDGTLAKSRLAFEAAARVAGISDDLASGFAELWRRALPGAKDAAKREPLNEVVRHLAKFQHLGRHRDRILTPVSRRDALLALRLSLALFEYLSCCLSEAATFPVASSDSPPALADAAIDGVLPTKPRGHRSTSLKANAKG